MTASSHPTRSLSTSWSPPRPAATETGPCTVTVATLDFKNKVEKTCSFAEVHTEGQEGRFVWVDIDASDPVEARRLLLELMVIGEETIDDALKNEPSTQIARYDDYVHLVVSGCRQRGR